MSDTPKDDEPAAISIPFGELPESNFIKGYRYSVSLPKTPEFVGLDFQIESTEVKTDPEHRLEFFAYEKFGPDGNEEEDMQRLREKYRSTDLVDHFRGQTSRQDHAKTAEILNRLPCGYTAIKVLPELIGLPVCNLVLGYLAALRPSCIRITGGEVHCDARQWRVTVTVDEHDKITDISQEVSVGFGTGADMNGLLREFKGGPPAPTYTGCAIGHTAALLRADFQ